MGKRGSSHARRDAERQGQEMEQGECLQGAPSVTYFLQLDLLKVYTVSPE